MNGIAEPNLVDVAVPYRVGRSFQYSVPETTESPVQLGSVVQVPFRNRQIYGFVVGFSNTSEVALNRIKAVDQVLTTRPAFDESMLALLRWVAEYYCHPLGEVIASAVPRSCWKAPRALKRKRKVTPSVDLRALAGADRPVLTAEQRGAVETILSPEDLRPILLHGVTGSGKTEVYLRVLESVLEQGKSAIVLVPEIALTPQLMARFAARFDQKIAVLHSDMSDRERFEQWEAVSEGKAKIVIGARSAVFAPVKDLGLIVVDEEHESSFKQEESFRYQARDIAIVRGAMSGAKVVLGSATPSLESYYNSQRGKYAYFRLAQRAKGGLMPTTVFVDLRQRPSAGPEHPAWLSDELVGAIEQTVGRGEQALIYLNRLGYGHFLYCADCGHTWRCRNCDVSLTYYRLPPLLKCHYCGHDTRVPATCEECEGLRIESMGVGTEQVAKVLSERFPKARIGRLDRSVVKSRGDLETLLAAIARREFDIVVGTQMVAKGHDFPGIGLVGVLTADASLNIPDFRASEKTYQTLTQVSGRAGRAEVKGTVLIQSFNPDHPALALAASGDFETFYRRELEIRQQFGFPPFVRLALLRFRHRAKPAVEQLSVNLCTRLSSEFSGRGIQVLGPSEAPIARLNGFFRWHCLLKANSVRELRQALSWAQAYLEHLKSPVQMSVDVDPLNTM